jgi:2'-5' RNA ligase
MARLFIAVWPTDEVVATLAMLPREGQEGIRFVPVENWHITLRFLGEANPDEVINALDDATLARARAHLGPAVELLAGRALVVPVLGLEALAGAVTEHTRHIGEAPGRRFVGHLTLARVKPHATTPLSLGIPLTIACDVDVVALVQSRLGPRGPRYETIRSWPLA